MKSHLVSKYRMERRCLVGVLWALLAVILLSDSLVVLRSAWAAGTTSAIHKVLFLGNSITRHSPAPAIGWTGNWGMAASIEEKDYVHLVTASLAKTTGSKPEIMVKNIADFERQYAKYDVAGKMKEPFAFEADLVILAIGENVPGLSSDEAKRQFEDSLTKLLQGLKANRQPMIVVRSCFWANQAKDQILKEVCRKAGGIFVDIGALGKVESNYARSERVFEHKGVAAHPGDQGMQAIARAIVDAVNNQQGKGKAK